MATTYKSNIPAILAKAEAKIRAANRHTAERIADGARSRIPRDTGRTAGTISVDQDADGTAIVTTDFPGHLLEFGSVKMPARPFMVPAAEAERDNHLHAIRKAFDE